MSVIGTTPSCSIGNRRMLARCRDREMTLILTHAGSIREWGKKKANGLWAASHMRSGRSPRTERRSLDAQGVRLLADQVPDIDKVDLLAHLLLMQLRADRS